MLVDGDEDAAFLCEWREYDVLCFCGGEGVHLPAYFGGADVDYALGGGDCGFAEGVAEGVVEAICVEVDVAVRDSADSGLFIEHSKVV